MELRKVVLHPAIWPETHSYALTLALRTGLPVVAFDLGAPGEGMGAYPNGHLLPYALATDPAALNDRLLAIDISVRGRLSGPTQAAAYDHLMRTITACWRDARCCPLSLRAAHRKRNTPFIGPSA